MNLKKKILGFVLAVFMLVPSLFLLTACGETKKAVEAITLNETAKTMVVGDTFNLVATVKPDDATEKAVDWSSSNENVVTVASDGLVTAVAIGTADVTVKSVDDETKSAVCHITVNAQPTRVTGITLSEEELDIQKGDTYTLVATVVPSDATNKEVVWTSSRPAYVSVDENGNLSAEMATGAERAVITATTKDGQYSASCQVKVFVPVTEITFDITEKTIFSTDEQGFSVEYSYNKDATELNFKWEVAADSKKLIKVSYGHGNTLNVKPLGKAGVAKFYLMCISEPDCDIKAECTVNLIAPYATIYNDNNATQYTNLQDAINAANDTVNTIYIHGYMPVDSTVSINKSNDISFKNGRAGKLDGIFASDKFVGGNLIEVEGSGRVMFDYLTLNAQKKARVMYISNTNEYGVKFSLVSFKNGKRADTWAPGLFITGKSVVTIESCTFEGNENNSEVKISDPTKYFATDIWAGSQTKVTLQGDCRIGRIVKNANYAGDANSVLVVALNSSYGGSIKELFVQYDEEYGTNNSIANKGTGVAGAIVKFVSGTIEKMYVANESNNVELINNPESGYIYQAGKGRIAI